MRYLVVAGVALAAGAGVYLARKRREVAQDVTS